MSETGSRPKQLVKAVFNFQPTNTDELSFQKGDVITVTQVIEGGWWEGTLRGTTGWFPSNYVRDLKGSADGRSGAKSPRCKSPESKVTKRDSSVVAVNTATQATGNHLVVLQELIGNEKKFVSLIEELVSCYLKPLETNAFLAADEYADVYSNLDDVLALHQSLLNLLEEAFKVPVAQQRFGRIFLETAPKFQSCYFKYSANHPKVAAVLQAKREDFSKHIESLGAPAPGIMTLTTRLSKPFQQIERYSNLLKELERHSDETHVDRGDTQRAVFVYRDIALSCAEIRRQKEMEFEILRGEIKGWEGEEISQLGEVLLLSHAWIQMENGERKERYMMLFSGCLVLFSIAAGGSGYSFEGKMGLSNATVSNVDESEKPAFEISGGIGVERLCITCISTQEKTKWLTHLKPHVKVMPISIAAKPQNLQVSAPSTSATGAKPITVPSAQVVNSSTFCKPIAVNSTAVILNNKWNVSCLRPCPPLRPSTFVKDDGTRSPRAARRILGSGRRKIDRTLSQEEYLRYRRIDDAKVLEEDAVILRVIEAYCTSAKVRQTVNSSLLENPQVLIAEEEKIIIEEIKGDQTVVEEKTLVDTVYSLKDQVRELRQEQQRMRKDLDSEKKARKRLESLLRNSLKNIVENTFEVHDTATGVANT